MKSQKLKYRIARVTILMFTIGMVMSLIWSCANKKKMSNGTNQESALLLQYVALNDSADHTWQIMIADDDEKHMLMKRLLQEVSFTNNYDKGRFKELNDLVD